MKHKHQTRHQRTPRDLVCPTSPGLSLGLLQCLAGVAHHLGAATGDMYGRLCIEIRYSMPVFADEILRGKE